MRSRTHPKSRSCGSSSTLDSANSRGRLILLIKGMNTGVGLHTICVEVLEKNRVFVTVAAADGEVMKHEHAEDTELGFPFAAERYVGIGFGASRLNLVGAVTYYRLGKLKCVLLLEYLPVHRGLGSRHHRTRTARKNRRRRSRQLQNHVKSLRTKLTIGLRDCTNQFRNNMLPIIISNYISSYKQNNLPHATPPKPKARAFSEAHLAWHAPKEAKLPLLSL